MKKKLNTLLAVLLVLVALFSLAGCGSTTTTETASATTAPETVAETEAPAAEAAPAAEEAAEFTGDGFDSTVDYAALAGTTITVAASPTPHAEILGVAKEILAQADITLDIKEFDDYIQPNMVVEDGEVFANYFQHVPYLDEFNEENGTHIVSVCGVHVEPMGVYAGKCDSFDNIADGATFAVPNDPTNEGRALALLEANGIITVDPAAGLTATKLDITDNPYNIEIVEVEAANIPNVLSDVDYGVINGNYAVGAGFNPISDSLAIEGSASSYVNILCVEEGNETSDEAKALAAALTSEQVRTFISENFEDGSVIAVF